MLEMEMQLAKKYINLCCLHVVELVKLLPVESITFSFSHFIAANASSSSEIIKRLEGTTPMYLCL